MQNLISSIETQTMSSVELVKLINDMRDSERPILAHTDFMTRIERISKETGISFKTDTYQNQQNKQFYPCALLDARLSKLMVMTESVKVQLAVLDRVTELEKAQPKLPTNYLEALTALVLAETEKQAALTKIDTDKPKVEFAEKVRALDGSISIGDFAKLIGTGQNRLFKRMREDGFLMVNNHPMQSSIERELLVQIEQTPFTDSKGKSHPAFQTRVTGKGQVYFEKKYRDALTNQLHVQ